ncbi:MAG: hypothetical protein ACLP8S_04490 [Solirubrobacteraceae bacterium]
MRAAEATGYASRPLLLFHAIGQSLPHTRYEPWRLSGHGLKHIPGESALRSTVKPAPGKADSFSVVAAVREQGGLTAPVELGALWASLPDLYVHHLRDERWRRPLFVVRHQEDLALLPSQLTRFSAEPSELLVADRFGFRGVWEIYVWA